MVEWAMTLKLFERLRHHDKPQQVAFDRHVVFGASLDDLEPALWQRFIPSLPNRDREICLIEAGLAGRDEFGVVRPTVAGLLMASREPRMWLPNAYIEAVAYGQPEETGMAGHSTFAAADIGGPLDHQILAACQFVMANMRRGPGIKPGRAGAYRQPLFAMTAVFEAVVNAVAHRDYGRSDFRIQLKLFASRLELISPSAALPSALEALDFQPLSHNEVLTRLLGQCPTPPDWAPNDRKTLMGGKGQGVPIILGDSERLCGIVPIYRGINEAELQLMIYAASIESPHAGLT
jgi:predicted HTH transcriptional regulator